MTIVLIAATIECDGCGGEFRVSMDVTRKIPENFSLHELAEDALAAGVIHDARTAACQNTSSMCSIRDGRHLCPACTAEKGSVTVEGSRNA